MIYCVVPPELEGELYDKLVEYYKDNPNVQVIVDRRDGRRAKTGSADPPRGSNRRRARIPGTFPEIEAH